MERKQLNFKFWGLKENFVVIWSISTSFPIQFNFFLKNPLNLPLKDAFSLTFCQNTIFHYIIKEL
jgi:hypothetical protein